MRAAIPDYQATEFLNRLGFDDQAAANILTELRTEYEFDGYFAIEFLIMKSIKFLNEQNQELLKRVQSLEMSTNR